MTVKHGVPYVHRPDILKIGENRREEVIWGGETINKGLQKVIWKAAIGAP